MKIIIGKDIRVENPNKAIIDYCNRQLEIDNPDFIIANKLGRYVGKMEKKLTLYVKDGNSLILPFGTLTDIWALSKGASYEIKTSLFKGNKLKGSINLYDYQERALQSLKKGKNGVLQAPCGSGKTQIGLQFIKEIGGKALWLTHTRKLMNQSKERAKNLFEGDFGEITEGKVNIGRDITFATVQTMRSIDTSIYENAFDIVIVDECHHCVGTPTKVMQFYKVITNCNCRYKIGLSATLDRNDSMSKCVYSLIGKKLHTITEEEVGSKRIKALHYKYDIDIEYNLRDYCNGDGTINYGNLINMLSDSWNRNQEILSVVKQISWKNKKQIILCHRVKQVEYLSQEIEKMGLKVNCLTGKVNDKNRQYDGDVIVATYSLAKEGLDIPDLDVLHLATPQKDKTTTIQSAGRVERNYEGKQTPLIIDYVDNNIDYCVSCFKKRKNILNKIK